MIALQELAPRAYFTTDVGQHQMWAAQFLHNGPRRWISSAGLGTMGYGMPAAMGVQIAFPDEQVICVAGDASILMNIQELGTLSQYNLPVKVVVINNGWQGMVRQWQESFYDERYSSSEMTGGMPDFPALAEAFGVRGVAITRALQPAPSSGRSPGPPRPGLHRREGAPQRELLPDGASRRQQRPDGGAAHPPRTGHRHHPAMQQLRHQHGQRPPLLPQLRRQALSLSRRWPDGCSGPRRPGGG